MKNCLQTIKDGGAVILPTETVYGLFADALKEAAVNHVYDLKQRPRDKAMNLNVSSLKDIVRFSKEQPPFLEKLFAHFLPGPLTIILKANEQVPTWINSGLDTIGFRVPNHPVTLKIIEETGPLIGPSANLSGQSSGQVFTEIQDQFQVALNGIEDDSYLSGQDSTILDLSGDRARILRQGSITKEALLSIVPDLPF
ncbi:L-threonylcarbamoyladenylate synthase [Streptococcus cameli]